MESPSFAFLVDPGLFNREVDRSSFLLVSVNLMNLKF
jgi:hypothetical protein